MSHFPIGPSSDLPQEIRAILNKAIESGQLTEKEVKQLIPSKWFWQGPSELTKERKQAFLDKLEKYQEAKAVKGSDGDEGSTDRKTAALVAQALLAIPDGQTYETQADYLQESQVDYVQSYAAALQRAAVVIANTPSKVAAQERWIDWFTNGLMQIGICLHLVSDRAQFDHAVGLLAKLCNNMASGVHIEGYKDVSVGDMKTPDVVLEALQKIINAAGVVPRSIIVDARPAGSQPMHGIAQNLHATKAPSSYEKAHLAEKWGPSLQAMNDMLEAMKLAQARISQPPTSLFSSDGSDLLSGSDGGFSTLETLKQSIQGQLQLWQKAQQQKPLTAGELRDCFNLQWDKSHILPWRQGVKKSFADENQKALYGENGGSSTNNAKDLVQNRLVGMLPKQLEESFKTATKGLSLPKGLKLKEAARALCQNKEGLEEFVRVLAILQFAHKADLTTTQTDAIEKVQFGQYTPADLQEVVKTLRAHVPGLSSKPSSGEVALEEEDAEDSTLWVQRANEELQAIFSYKTRKNEYPKWKQLSGICGDIMRGETALHEVWDNMEDEWDACMQDPVASIRALFQGTGENAPPAITITPPTGAAWGETSETASKFLQILGALYVIGSSGSKTAKICLLKIDDLNLAFAQAQDVEALNQLLDAALDKLKEPYLLCLPPPSPPKKRLRRSDNVSDAELL